LGKAIYATVDLDEDLAVDSEELDMILLLSGRGNLS
jgi:hypothetical protein